MSYIGNQPVLNTSEFREEFAVTSTNTQTVFNTSGFVTNTNSEFLEVYRNGVLLSKDDYSLDSDAATITLNNAAVSGDIIVIKGRRELTNGVQVTERRHEHTMGSGETTVTFPYPLTVSQTDLYLNGVKLGSSDFSINSSTRVVSFTTNPAVGDLVAIVSREPALTANSSLPVVDAAGTNVLSESGGVVTLTADDLAVNGTSSLDGAVVINDSGADVDFRVESDTDANAFFLDGATGNVGFGTSSPSSFSTYRFLDLVGGGTTTGGIFQSKTSDGAVVNTFYTTGSAGAVGTSSSHALQFITGDIERMRIDSSGNIGAPSGTNIYNASDQRLKQNITDLSGCLQKVLLMRGVSFNWIDKFCDSEADKTLYGLIAQELQTVDVNLVDSFSDNTITAGEVTVENPLRVNEKFIIPMLVESIKEQQTLIESQQSQIDALTARIEALETPAE